MMLLRRLPMILLALGAIVFALIRWKHNARASLMTVIAFFIYLVDMVALNVFLFWFPQLIASWHLSPSARVWIDGIIFFLEDFAAAAIIILLTAAAFSGRNKSSIETAQAS